MAGGLIDIAGERRVSSYFNGKYEVDEKTGCWNWTWSRMYQGYGHTFYEGKVQRVPRVAAKIMKWDIQGKEVCHSCDNPACFYPSHLFVGSHAENMQDAAQKNRMVWGVRHPAAKIDEAGVALISELRAAGIGVREIGRRFKITHAGVQHILKFRVDQEKNRCLVP